MATLKEIVRAHTSDDYIYDHAEKVADGNRADFDLPNAPVLTDSEKVWVNGALKAKPADYTIDDATGVVTFVAPPAASALVVITYKWSILSDAKLDIFLAENGDVARLAAADALDAIASSEALVQKVIKTLDFSTDGAAVANSLRAHAKALRDQDAVLVAAEDQGAFDWAEMVLDEYTLAERLSKQSVIQ